MRNLLFQFVKSTIKKHLFEVFLFSVLGFAAIFLLYWFSRSKQSVLVELQSSAHNTAYTGHLPLGYEIAGSIDVGDIGYDDFGNSVAEVIDLFRTEYGGEFKYIRTVVKLDVLKENKTGLYKYKNQRLIIGEDLRLILGDTSFQGKISNIYQTEEEYRQKTQMATKKMKVRLFVQDVLPWNVEQFKNGFSITDDRGNTIFSVLEVTKVTDSIPFLVTKSGKIVEKRNDLFKDVELTAEIFVNCENDVCYFNHFQPVKIGLSLWAQGNIGYLSNGIIMEMIEE